MRGPLRAVTGTAGAPGSITAHRCCRWPGPPSLLQKALGRRGAPAAPCPQASHQAPSGHPTGTAPCVPAPCYSPGLRHGPVLGTEADAWLGFGMASTDLERVGAQARVLTVPQLPPSAAQANERKRKISFRRRKACGLITVRLQSACKSPREAFAVGAKCEGFLKR